MLGMRNPSAQRHPDAIVLDRYVDLEQFLHSFTNGGLDLLLIIGRPGTGKSQAVRSMLDRTVLKTEHGEQGLLYVEGHMGSFGLYRQLYQHRDCPVVIDDFDRLHSRPDCIRLLKPLCNNTQKKRITWYSNATHHQSDLPDSFTTESRVVLIANDWRSLNHDVRALEDRAIVVEFAPSNQAVHEYVGGWFDDTVIYNLIATVLSVSPPISIRSYLKGRSLRDAGLPSWKQAVLQMVLGDPILATVAELRSSVFGSEADRVAAFSQRTGRSRATYFRLKRQITALAGQKTEGADTPDGGTG